MIIGITGTSSEIGKEVVFACQSRGHEVIEYSRKNLDGQRYFEIGEYFDPESLIGIDALIHLAWDWQDTSNPHSSRNVQSGNDLIQQAGAFRIPTTLLSSFSAEIENSIYGSQKYALEQTVLSNNGKIIRAAIVWGGTGTFGIMQTLRKIAKIPIFFPNVWPNALVHQTNLCWLSQQLVQSVEDAQFPDISKCADINPISLNYVLKLLRPWKFGIKVPIPVQFILPLLSFLELLQIKLPLRSDSLRAIIGVKETDSYSLPFRKNGPSNSDFYYWLTNQNQLIG